LDIRILNLIATVIECCEPPRERAPGQARAEIVRVLATLCQFLHEGTPWRDLLDEPGYRPSVHHRWRRWCVRGWWELVFEALPTGGLVLLDSTRARRSAFGCSRGGLCSKLHACAMPCLCMRHHRA
jgi:transposase